MYLWDPSLIITTYAVNLSPSGARSPEGTVQTEQLDIHCSKFLWLSTSSNHIWTRWSFSKWPTKFDDISWAFEFWEKNIGSSLGLILLASVLSQFNFGRTFLHCISFEIRPPYGLYILYTPWKHTYFIMCKMLSWSFPHKLDKLNMICSSSWRLQSRKWNGPLGRLLEFGIVRWQVLKVKFCLNEPRWAQTNICLTYVLEIMMDGGSDMRWLRQVYGSVLLCSRRHQGPDSI